MAEKKCNQPSCTYNTDGKCLEGLGVDCSHLLLEELTPLIEAKTEEEKETPTVVANNNIKLYTGEELLLKDITLFSHKFPYRLITILGDFDCGKTTLLATLFDLFQMGSFHEFIFAGSLTQIGFEKRCHLSRSCSNRTTPDTERTKVKEFGFLHLAVKKKNRINKRAINLLISDVSGERMKQARNSSASMQEIQFIKKSDYIIVMIDGHKISNLKERNKELFNSEQFIQKAIEENVFGKQTDLKIVLSKWDLLYKDPNFNFSDIIEDPLKKKFEGKLRSIEFSQIASRPAIQDEIIKLGFGLHNFLMQWTRDKTNPTEPFEVFESKRVFDNYRFNYI